MSRSPISTVPVARAMGLVSCMRFRQRTKVLLPQPDGPISAVAWLPGIFRLMSCKLWFVPYHAFRLITSMLTPTCGFLLLVRVESRRDAREGSWQNKLAANANCYLSKHRGW